jgi:hypothetical protein
MKKYIFLFFLSSLLLSCAKEIDASFLNAPEEVVLQCYISPSDTTIRATLVKATSFTSAETQFSDLFIKDATITIGDESMNRQLIFNSKSQHYELTTSNLFKIQHSKTYFIRVLLKNGRLLTSQCSVPARTIKPNEVEIEKSYRGNDLVDIRLKWLKNNNENYIIRPYYYYILKDKEYTIAQKEQFFKSANIIEDIAISNYYTNDLTISSKKNTVFFYLSDENFYAYAKSVKLNSNNQDDPFSQPINVTSNINGGKGCFGAYTVTRIDYEF